MQINERGLPQRNRSFPLNFCANPEYGSLADFVNIIILVRFLSFRSFRYRTCEYVNVTLVNNTRHIVSVYHVNPTKI